MRFLGQAAWIAASLCALVTAPAAAQPFYENKQLNLIVSFNPGGGGDLYARLVARHIGHHIAGAPTLVVKNMPGAGGVTAANHLFRLSPKDGTEIGLFPGNIVTLPLVGGVPTQYDAKGFAWIGSPASESDVCVASPAAAVKRFDDLFTQTMVTGTAGTATFEVPSILNAVLGTKFKLVNGYNGSAGLRLATERHEIDGFCGIGYDSLKSAGVMDGKLTVLVQVALKKDPAIPDVPSALDYAKTPDDLQVMRLVFGWADMARPIAAPPGTPADRVALLRQAFDDTVKDPAFLADAAKQSLSINAAEGADIASFVADVYKTPQPLIDRAAHLLQRD